MHFQGGSVTMNRHSRKQLLREIEAYLAFWTIVQGN